MRPTVSTPPLRWKALEAVLAPTRPKRSAPPTKLLVMLPLLRVIAADPEAPFAMTRLAPARVVMLTVPPLTSSSLFAEVSLPMA